MSDTEPSATAGTASSSLRETAPPRVGGLGGAGREAGIRRRRADRMIVASGEFQHAVDLAAGFARSSDTVVIFGPEGSGRRHIARAFHGWSPQASGPLVEVALSGLAESEQEQSLFGNGQSKGAIAEASRGTMVLLEAESLTLSLRERLTDTLRAQQAGADAAGSGTRIVATAATEDAALFPGIAVKSIAVSGLAQRKEDILPLAAHFLAEFAIEQGVEPIGFTGDATTALLENPWTGNVRELRARVREAVRLSGTGAISVEALMLANEGDEILSFKEAKRAFETRYVEGLLRRCSGNISRAARLAKKDRKDFYDVIRRTGVEPSQFRS
jgi:two-component system, NtrC family, response regulator GlrR